MEPAAAETLRNGHVAAHHIGRESAQNLLVPQGGFEPSTYRLRSDCSAVELLRRPERAFYQTFYQTSRPQLKRVISPFVPAKAGTQSKRLDSQQKRVYARLRRAMRENERWKRNSSNV